MSVADAEKEIPSEKFSSNETEIYNVGEFLDVVNGSFEGMRIAIRGEISGFEERRGMRYFSLRDPEDDAMIACVVFPRTFFISGVILEDGMEIIVEGNPNIWKPRGRFSFVVSVIREIGEGALQKAYTDLRTRLDREGVFSENRKRLLPEFPERIALITSREGAAIGDFSANLSRNGFTVSLCDTIVEGKRSIESILSAIASFSRTASRWDVLVLVRGGGSLESLEAFNSEPVVRAIASCPIPTLAGIGHEKDVSLTALAADRMVSTPTAAARTLGESWEIASERILTLDRYIERAFLALLGDARGRWQETNHRLSNAFHLPQRQRDLAEVKWRRMMEIFAYHLEKNTLNTDKFWHTAHEKYSGALTIMTQNLKTKETLFSAHDPRRILSRGYSILRKGNRVIRSVHNLAPGEVFSATLSDGTVEAKVFEKS